MRKHWQQEGPMRPGLGHHALLWVDTEPVPTRHGGDGLSVRAVARRAWPLASGGPQVYLSAPLDFTGPDALAALVARLAPPKRRLVLWLSHGWESLVLTGLAELMERGTYHYDHCMIDGARVILRGRLGTRRVDVTSLAALTGGEWDGWRAAVADMHTRHADARRGARTSDAYAAAGADEQCALGTVIAVLDGCRRMALGPVRLSLGAQARSWWRAWGAPILPQARSDAKRPTGRNAGAGRVLVPPVPQRPKLAAQAEAHCAHGLVREQFVCGHYAGRIHIVDLASAYLLGLMCGQLPVTYRERLDGLSPLQLGAALEEAAGCALVRLEDCPRPFFSARGQRPRRAVGSYWAWLAQPDVMTALELDRIAECHSVYVWSAVRRAPSDQADLLGLSDGIAAGSYPYLAPLWRGIYSALVGGWAQARWDWLDAPGGSAFGPWASWIQPGRVEGTRERWRAVAGRVQRQVYRGEAAHALPLAYATVTAYVRDQVDWCRESLPAGSVLATACDALWLTDAGLAAMEAGGGGLARQQGRWRVKDTLDEAWLDGRGSAVVRRGGLLYPLLPGVPAGVPMGEDGRASWGRALPWDQCRGARPDRPCKRTRATFDGARLIKSCDHPPRPVVPWLALRQRALPEALLLPYDPQEVATDDDA